MSNAHAAVDASLTEVERLRRTLKKGNRQVRSEEERSLIRAVCLAWFNNHREAILESVDDGLLSDVDGLFKQMLTACDRATTRNSYDQILKRLRTLLSEIRGYAVGPRPRGAKLTTDIPPSFSTLVPNREMQGILQ